MKNKIKHLHFFEWLSDESIDNFLENSKFWLFKKWDILIKQSSLWKKSYILSKWILRVEKDGKNINTLFEWEIFWEIWPSFNEARSANIIAETDGEYIEITQKWLENLLKNTSEWGYLKTTILSRIMQNHK